MGAQSKYRSAQKRLIGVLESDESSNRSSSLDSSESTDKSSPSKSDGSSENSNGSMNSIGSMTVTDNGETISCHQGMGSLLLVEHNFLCEAFIIATSCSGIQQYLRILPCLLNSLNKIWTQMEWNSEYVHSVSGLTRLFSDVRFLKMAYHVVKFCEENLKRSKVEESDACDICSVPFTINPSPSLTAASMYTCALECKWFV